MSGLLLRAADLLSLGLLGLGLVFWFAGTWPLLGRASFLTKLHYLGVADTLGSALLPLTAILLVAQTNPYQTLVLRGILGAVAALVYALLGAADVALTEALVGTLLSTTLYAVALRSSMVLRLGCADPQEVPAALKTQLARWLEPASLRLELVSQGPAAQNLHGLLEWQGAAQPPRVWLHNGGLRRRLAELLAAAAWQPELLPLERIEPEQIQPERTGSDPASGSEHAGEVGR